MRQILLALALIGAGALSLLPVAQAATPSSASDAGPEAQLTRILADIEANRLDDAAKKTDALLSQYPNFRLAHLIKGDLLLARSKPIQTFGAASNAPKDRLDDLRDEAIVRLKAYRDKPQTRYVPRYLLQMQADQKFAIVVDTAKSRLYLYQNDIANGGRPRFVADYYITHGKLGTEKTREGDKKTPIGVYHVTSSLPAQRIGDLYGIGAYPLDYPNEWDRRQGRSGHGIWLHGTPSNTYSRPPKASDGCVVLTNADLTALSKNLQIGLTPVIISNSIEWLSLDDWQAERTALTRAIEEWRTDWESRDINRYLSHYSKRFQAGNQSLEQFAQQKRQVNAGKEWIKVRLLNPSIFRNPGKEEFVVVTFDQDYRSNNLSNEMRKRQYWIREDGAWKIIYEGSA
ncbi:L,D-transpeptidase family protein [Rhodocyclus tenuis]|uniref:L,D-transpeptidase family protein n=1 Tax=Rhodocyclus gracilis TaxID=2929842 RepID=A0ABX0WGQ0_9RHOO|nr:L,D-transpeptidase family protein [Rhodocyclus gracilis]NJA88901.1 L,D-transpeptidase family protein [Rhodocyclus gracilis]